MKEVCRSLLFTKTPLKGGFGFKHHFQVYPCPFPNAPQSKQADNPVVVEFWVDDKENPDVDPDIPADLKDKFGFAANRQNRATRISRLLSALTNHRFAVHDAPSHRWGWQWPKDGEKATNSPSVVYLDWYDYPEMQLDLSIERMVPAQFDEAPLVPHKEYYTNNPVEGRHLEIKFSDETWRMLNNYFAMDASSRQRVDTVAHLICNGLDLQEKMKSLSFLAFVSSIETLSSYHYQHDKAKTCPSCSQPVWEVGKKFRTFLETFVSPHKDSVKDYKRVYDLRSKIVHSGALLLGDEERVWLRNDEPTEEGLLHINARQLARLALANWLGMSAKPTDKPQFA